MKNLTANIRWTNNERYHGSVQKREQRDTGKFASDLECNEHTSMIPGLLWEKLL